MKRSILLCLSLCMTAPLLHAGTIGVERMDTYDTGIRLANGQWKIGSGVKMKYYGFFGDVTSTTWETWHWINNISSGDVIAGGSAGSVTTDIWTSTVEGIADFNACHQGKAIAQAGGATQDVGGNHVCTDPSPYVPPKPPCSGCSADGTGPVEYVGTPLVVNTGNGPWELSSLDDPVLFDIDADGRTDRMAWTARGSSLAFVALDFNGNGRIDDASELFGDHTGLLNGATASNGFAALKTYDQNGDDVIDAGDAVWSSLLLWTDADHDGISQPSELTSTAHSTIRGLGTAYRHSGRTDSYGNEFRFKSQLIKERGRESYYDIYFRVAP